MHRYVFDLLVVFDKAFTSLRKWLAWLQRDNWRVKKETHDNWIYLVKYPFYFGDEQKLFFAIWEGVGFLRRLQNFLTFDVKCMFTVNVTTLPALYITRRLES